MNRFVAKWCGASEFKNSAGYERKIASEFYHFEMTWFLKTIFELNVY
jgi:hypothetical protein